MKGICRYTYRQANGRLVHCAKSAVKRSAKLPQTGGRGHCPKHLELLRLRR